jgi:hypothetical protein
MARIHCAEKLDQGITHAVAGEVGHALAERGRVREADDAGGWVIVRAEFSMAE